MKLLGMFKSRIIKDKNGENVPRLEITEVVLVQCNIVNNNYQQNSIHLFLINYGLLLDISPKNFIFLSVDPKFLIYFKCCLLIRILCH